MKNRSLHLWLIRFIGLIVPQRLRADWRVVLRNCVQRAPDDGYHVCRRSVAVKGKAGAD